MLNIIKSLRKQIVDLKDQLKAAKDKIPKKGTVKRLNIVSRVVVDKRKPAPRLGTKRKNERYASPLTGNLVLRPTYLKALKEYKRREKVWQDNVRKVERMSKLFMPKEITITIPKIELSLSEARYYELHLAGGRRVGFMKGSKFVNLFRRRISRIKGEWNKVTTTVVVEIQDDTAPYGTPNTKTTIGPFEDKMPPGLSERDQYQFLMYVLFKDNRFRTQSGEYIAKIGGSITVLNKVKMKDIRMGSTRLISVLVNRCNGMKKIQQNNGTCVQDYIYEACKGEDGFKRYSKVL